MAIEFRLLFTLALISIGLAEPKREQYEDLVRQMSSSIRSNLVILAHTAQEAHPKLGLTQPLDPLPAQGPLRYTNDGDLLKLRLLLSNVTLTGLSSLNLQEISFDGYPKMDGFTGHNKTKPDVVVTTENSFIYEDSLPHISADPEEKASDYDYRDKSYDQYYYYDTNHHDHQNKRTNNDDDGFKEYDDFDGSFSDRKVGHTRYERSISDRRLRHSHQHRRKIHQPLVFQIKTPPKHVTRHDRRSQKSTRSAPPSMKPERVSSSVRVALNGLCVKAQYVIRGSAGGVFTFKEQGSLELMIPNVFLTSRFNMTVTPEHPGMRHWNSKKYHVKVQKVETRMTLESPTLDLTPNSRSPEWIRRQVQEKMDELAAGVGRRDGAIRLLLRHWAKLLRRLVLKASKNYQSMNDK